MKKNYFLNSLYFGSIVISLISIFLLPNFLNNRELIFNEISNFISIQHDNEMQIDKKPLEKLELQRNFHKCNLACAGKCGLKESEQFEKCLNECGCENSKYIILK